VPVVGHARYHNQARGGMSDLFITYEDAAPLSYSPAVMNDNAVVQSLRKVVRQRVITTDRHLSEAYALMLPRIRALWYGVGLISVTDAVRNMDKKTGPGYNYYYDSSTKAEALQKHGQRIFDTHKRMLVGDPAAFVGQTATATLKDELRPVEKVAAGHLRIFQAMAVDHLLTCSVLFTEQNERLMINRSLHPITLGIQMPGPEFVSLMMSVYKGYDGDGDGFDLHFGAKQAQLVRHLRKDFLGEEYHACIDHLYDSVFGGYCVEQGTVYHAPWQKSGWFNTGADGSLYMWAANLHTFHCMYPSLAFDDYIVLGVNIDDWIFGFKRDFSFDVLKYVSLLHDNWNLTLELGSHVPQPSGSLTFLSHNLMWRYVDGLGDFLMAAGNKNKLLASRHFKAKNRSGTMSEKEHTLAHLLGVRFCLFPWREDFLIIDAAIDTFLKNCVITTIMQTLLHVRLSEQQIAYLHVRTEGGIGCLNQIEPDKTALLLMSFLRKIPFKVPGTNYCGPGYCGGSFDEHCDYTVEPTSEFDEFCRSHDQLTDIDPAKADRLFSRALQAKGGVFTPVAAYFDIQKDFQPAEQMPRKTRGKSHGARGVQRLPGQGQSKKAIRRRAARQGAPRVNRRTPNYYGARAEQRSRIMSAPVQQSIAMRPNSFAFSGSRNMRTGDKINVSGREYLMQLSIPSSAASGDVLYSFSLTPAAFPSRLQLFAQLYEMYCFKRASIEFVPAQTSAQVGQIVAYWELDADESDPGGSVQLIRANNSISFKNWNLWSVAQGDCTKQADKKKQTWYCDLNDVSDARLTTQALFKIVCAIPPTLNGTADTVVVGTFYIKYDVDLISPCYAPANVAAAEVPVIYGNKFIHTAGTNPYFTIYPADFNIPSCTTSTVMNGTTGGGIDLNKLPLGDWIIVFTIPRTAAVGTSSHHVSYGVPAPNTYTLLSTDTPLGTTSTGSLTTIIHLVVKNANCSINYSPQYTSGSTLSDGYCLCIPYTLPLKKRAKDPIGQLTADLNDLRALFMERTASSPSRVLELLSSDDDTMLCATKEPQRRLKK